VNLLNTILIDVSLFVIVVMYIDIQLVTFNNKHPFLKKGIYACGISTPPNTTDVVHTYGVPCGRHQCLCYLWRSAGTPPV
jgi:hypothetical protein